MWPTLIPLWRTRSGKTANRSAPRRRPQLEMLEDRTVPSTFVVNTTADTDTYTSNPSITSGSLRDAINYANNDTSGLTIIDFAIPTNGGVATITPLSPLPAIMPTIMHPITIDGYSQTGASPISAANDDTATLMVELNCVNIPSTVSVPNDYFVNAGLAIAANNCTVQGLAIYNFGAAAIAINGNNNIIQGDFVGTDASGISAPFAPNLNQISAIGHAGIYLEGGSGNRVGTDGQSATNDPAQRNVIAGNNYGVVVAGASSSVVAGNFIGTERHGTRALANWVGIGTDLGSNHDRIGTNGTDPDTTGERNIISGNAVGIAFGVGRPTAAETDGLVAGNWIGLDVNGNALGNTGAGIFVGVSSSAINIGGNQAVLGNTIANTTSGPGVWIVDFVGAPTGIRLQGNSIQDNAGLGIVLGGSYPTPPTVPLANDSAGHTGPNNFQNYPLLSAASSTSTDTSISGTFSQADLQGKTITLDFYANPTPPHLQSDGHYYGEGQTWLGSATVTTDSSGNAHFAEDLPVSVPAGQWISATATDSNGNTSEFSADVQVASGTFAQQLPSALPQSSTSPNALTVQASPNTIDSVVAALSPTNLGQQVTTVSPSSTLEG